MKNTIKRFLSLLLAVCMLLPCVPAGVVAIESTEQTQPVQVVYDFQLELTDKVNSGGSSFGGAAQAEKDLCRTAGTANRINANFSPQRSPGRRLSAGGSLFTISIMG